MGERKQLKPAPCFVSDGTTVASSDFLFHFSGCERFPWQPGSTRIAIRGIRFTWGRFIFPHLGYRHRHLRNRNSLSPGSAARSTPAKSIFANFRLAQAGICLVLFTDGSGQVQILTAHSSDAGNEGGFNAPSQPGPHYASRLASLSHSVSFPPASRDYCSSFKHSLFITRETL